MGEQELKDEARGQRDGMTVVGWGCLVAAACCAALALIGAGWLVYLACRCWPALERWSPPLGWALMAFGAVCLCVPKREG